MYRIVQHGSNSGWKSSPATKRLDHCSRKMCSHVWNNAPERENAGSSSGSHRPSSIKTNNVVDHRVHPVDTSRKTTFFVRSRVAGCLSCGYGKLTKFLNRRDGFLFEYQLLVKYAVLNIFIASRIRVQKNNRLQYINLALDVYLFISMRVII